MTIRNLYKPVLGQLHEERIDILAESDNFRIERIVSRGHASPAGFWYDQELSEFVTLLSGSATLELKDPYERIQLKPGDYCTIAAHRKHRVLETSSSVDTIWLTVFFTDG